MTDKEIDAILLEARNNYSKNQKFIKLLKKKNKKQVAKLFHEAHQVVFSEFDCLSCARCCKELGPRLLSRDIDNLAQKCKMPIDKFMNQYIKKDEDGDFVFSSMPCPFLMPDNYCTVYEKRPKACSAYPHTDETGIVRNLPTALKNTLYCPAVSLIFEEVQQETS